MQIENRRSNYDKYPKVRKGDFAGQAFDGYDDIVKAVQREINFQNRKKLIYDSLLSRIKSSETTGGYSV